MKKCRGRMVCDPKRGIPYERKKKNNHNDNINNIIASSYTNTNCCN